MAFDPQQKAAQLKLNQSRRPDVSSNKNALNANAKPSANDAIASAQQRSQGQGLRNPPEMQKALQLAKQLGHGRRDRSKSMVAQGLGEAGARGGQLLGGTVGSAVPVVGSTAGAIIGKRIGRLAGENWKVTLGVLAAWVFLQLSLFIALVGTVLLVVTSLANNVKEAAVGAAASGATGAAGVGLGAAIDYFSK